MEFSFVFIMTIIDFNFKVLAGTAYSGVELTGYLGKMASFANMISALVLIFLSGRIQRLFGLRVAISFIPIIVGSAFLFFVNINPSLQMMFILVVIGKAVNYAFRPSFKQLYIPTSSIIHFKLQAWNDVFGSRSAKQMGSMFNILFRIIGKTKYLMLGKIIGLPLVITWTISAIYLGKTCDKAIDEKRIII
jgi:AAA family ATP:ADP antiporter